MQFSRQEYWSGLPFPSPGDLPDPGIELGSPALQADTLSPEPPGWPWKTEYQLRVLEAITCIWQGNTGNTAQERDGRSEKKKKEKKKTRLSMSHNSCGQ